MRSFKVQCTVVALCLTAEALALAASESDALSVNVKLITRTTNDCIVEITATNRTQHAVTIATADAPWNPFSRRLTMVLVNAREPHSQIPRLPIVADAVVGSLTLKPRGGITERLSLKYSHPELIEALQNDDVILFWSYVFVSRESGEGPRCGGWLLIPRLSATRQ